MTLSAREVAMKLRDALGLAIMYVKGDQLANVWANYPELPERTLLQVLEDAYAATLPPEPVAVPLEVRLALTVLLNHVEPGWDNCKMVVSAWLAAAPKPGGKP